MTERSRQSGEGAAARAAVGVGMRVRVESRESTGVIIEDFGHQPTGPAIKVGDRLVAGPRRYAIMLDQGGLICRGSPRAAFPDLH